MLFFIINVIVIYQLILAIISSIIVCIHGLEVIVFGKYNVFIY